MACPSYRITGQMHGDRPKLDIRLATVAAYAIDLYESAFRFWPNQAEPQFNMSKKGLVLGQIVEV